MYMSQYDDNVQELYFNNPTGHPQYGGPLRGNNPQYLEILSICIKSVNVGDNMAVALRNQNLHQKDPNITNILALHENLRTGTNNWDDRTLRSIVTDAKTLSNLTGIPLNTIFTRIIESGANNNAKVALKHRIARGIEASLKNDKSCFTEDERNKFTRSLGFNEDQKAFINKAAGPSINKAAGPDINKATGPDINKAAGPDINKAAGPDINKATGPDINKATGPDINKAAGPDINKATGPGFLQSIANWFKNLLLNNPPQQSTSAEPPTVVRMEGRKASANQIEDNSASTVGNGIVSALKSHFSAQRNIQDKQQNASEMTEMGNTNPLVTAEQPKGTPPSDVASRMLSAVRSEEKTSKEMMDIIREHSPSTVPPPTSTDASGQGNDHVKTDRDPPFSP
jgi:hypothetical protein